jgi:hypothetical protein
MRKLVIFPADLLLAPDRRGFDGELVKQIKACESDHWFVAVSNRPKPTWFAQNGTSAVYCNVPALNGRSRENGTFVAELLRLNQEKLKLKQSQMVVLGYGDRDVPMFANSGSVLIRCDWRTDLSTKIRRYGVPCPKPSYLPRILALLNEENPWYFTANDPLFDTYCLTNAATRLGSDEEHKALAAQLQACLKHGAATKQVDFMVHALSSIYAMDAFRKADAWCFYPSAHSDNDGKEVIAEFMELPRITFGIRQSKGPLLLRHAKTASRHTGPQDKREDPTSQVRTIHLNREYREVISGGTIVVLDDFMNHGISFSVAASFLKKAGAKKVLGVAMGKFPRTYRVREIELATSPFSPVRDFRIIRTATESGTYNRAASEEFKKKFA